MDLLQELKFILLSACMQMLAIDQMCSQLARQAVVACYWLASML